MKHISAKVKKLPSKISVFCQARLNLSHILVFLNIVNVLIWYSDFYIKELYDKKIKKNNKKFLQ